MKKPKASVAIVMGKPDVGDEDAEDDDDAAASDLELKAIKAFDKAATPEDRALALRSFVKACMAGEEY